MGVSSWIPQWIVDKVTTGQQVSDGLDTAFGNIDTDLAAKEVEITDLKAPKTALVATGHIPAVVLNVENGGAASTVETTYNNGTTTHAVSTIQWLASQNEADWTLSNKDTGVTETMFRIINGGKASIGTGLYQSEVATVDDIASLPKYFDVLDERGVDLDTLKTNGRYYTNGANRPAHSTAGVMEVSTDEATGHIIQITETDGDFKKWLRAFDGSSWSAWVEDNTSHVIGLAFNMIIGKASKSSLPTIYSGSTVPDNSMGKNLDWYHHFEAGSTIEKNLYDSQCRDGYSGNLITLAASYAGDTPQNDIAIVELTPHNQLIYIDLENNSTLPIEEITLEINNYGEASVDIPIVVQSNSAGSFMGSYSTSYNPVIEKIRGNQDANPSSFKIKVKEGVLTDKEYDYHKHNGEWLRQDFLSTDEVNELIRSYDVTIEMNTGHNIPTKTECINAFEQLPHGDYTKDDSYHIMSTNKDRMNFVKYLANGSIDANSYTVGLFFVQELALAT